MQRSFGVGSGSPRVVAAAHEALAGKRRGIAALLPFAGPAFVASVAYMDPGNFATNIAGGARFGYRLLWVVVLANLMAMLFQGLSAKLGIATGKNLAELSRENTSKAVAFTMWIVAEVGAMATDLAEFLGAIVALYLLFHIPMLVGALITAVVTYVILALHRYGFRTMEALIGSLVGVIAVCYVVETLISRPQWNQILYHSVVPWLGGSSSLFLAVGIVGATVMPHAIYLHSALTQDRIVPEREEYRGRLVRFAYADVVVALAIAGVVNLAMMYMSAAVFHTTGHTAVADIATAYRTLTPLLGNLAAVIFLIALLASGISSSVVGTMAGQSSCKALLVFGAAVGAAPRYDAAGGNRRRDRRQRDADAGAEPGRAQLRSAGAGDRAGLARFAPGDDGAAGQRTLDDCARRNGSDRHTIAKRRVALRNDPRRLDRDLVIFGRRRCFARDRSARA